MNGSITFVCAGEKKDLEEKVKKEFGADRDEAKARIKEQIDRAIKRVENKKPKKSLYHLTEVNKTKKNEAKREDIAKQICCHAQRVLWQQMG